MTDAKFEDGTDTPLRLMAHDEAGLDVISALLQDAVFPITEMRYDRKRRRFALLLNRFRWEDSPAAQRGQRPFERVQSLLTFDDAQSVQTQGINRSDRDMVLSLLSIAFVPGPDGTGRIDLILAGDGAIALQVETLDATLTDVSRPYAAPSGQMPKHDI